MEYKDLYKRRPIPKLSDALAKRCQSAAADRQEKQRELFWQKRVLQQRNSPAVKKAESKEKVKNSRAEMLAKWKAEKLKKLEEAKKFKKPVFKVGIVHKKATGSPNLDKNTLKFKTKLCNEKMTCGVTTRSKAKAMASTNSMPSNANKEAVGKKNVLLQKQFCKVDVGVCKTVNSYKFRAPKAVVELIQCNKLTYPSSPKLTKSIRKQSKRIEAKQKELKKLDFTSVSQNENIVKNEKAANVRDDIVMKENFSPLNTTEEVKVTLEDDEYRPIHYSPFVTKRQSRKSGRKSQEKKTLTIDDEIKKEEEEFNCRLFSFKKYIECETKRLLNKCDTWKSICEQTQDMPSEIVGEIYSVTGKTNLLTSDKFIQFKNLIEKCEKKDPLIKLDDLQGFQDWVSIEVERIDKDFFELEERKRNNWILQTTEVRNCNTQNLQQNKKKAKKPMGKSNIRAHIEAVRKGLKTNAVAHALPVTSPANFSTPTNKIEIKRKSSTLKCGLEKRNSGLEIMWASQNSKSNPIKFLQKNTDDLAVIKLAETPSKGILRQSPYNLRTPKNKVIFKLGSEVKGQCLGLDEKYFRPAEEDPCSPWHLIGGKASQSNESLKVVERATPVKSNCYLR